MKNNEKMTVKPRLEKEWEKCVETNQDEYGNFVVIAAVKISKLLDKNKTCEEAEKGFYGFGLTGYQAGCIAGIISYYHPRGDEFRRFWNKLNKTKI